ncbi:MAG: TlpA disulfide reductase family protein [Balneolales bacterium]
MNCSIFLYLVILFIGFLPQQSTKPVDKTQPYIERQPIHYKYAPKVELPVTQNEDGSYRVEVATDSLEIVTLHYVGETYPLLVGQDKAIDVHIDRAWFPGNTRVEGFSSQLNEAYQEFLPEEQVLKRAIRKEMPRFRENENNRVLHFQKQLIELNRKYFEGTGFDDFIYKAKGEYLVKALNEVQYKRDISGYDAESARQAILEEAVEMKFFTLKSLKAQRAGIRDFTNSYSNTFGVKSKYDAEHDADLLSYEVKRLGYDTLNAARISVLDFIEDEDAYAHAKMYLVAERIGEAPFDRAEPTYFDFLENYSGYSEYTAFLTDHYEGIKSVQPGQPAVEFSIKDFQGQTRTMADFSGKFVLLDLWASWCIPCLQEFPHMERLYEKYDREDFEIVALSIENDRNAWENAVQRYNHLWPQLHDEGEFQQETFTAYRGGGIPFYMLINRDGEIERHNDIRASFNLEEVLDSLIYAD